MSAAEVFKKVSKRYPDLQKLPRADLKLVKDALAYANSLRVGDDELISEEEHEELMRAITPKGGDTPGNALRAYRFREEFTQAELAKLSSISQANISAMEHGRRPIGLNVAKKLAKILNCNYKRLV